MLRLVCDTVALHSIQDTATGLDGLTPMRGMVKLATIRMTTANKISIFRILLVPVFIAQILYYVESGLEWHRIAAIATFSLAAISDGIDGYLARHFNQRSELGAILDPLADKLLLVAGIVLLSFHHETYLPRVPLWLPVTVISRDLILLTGMVVINHLCGKTRVRPHWIGKVATVLQMSAILWGLFKLDSRGLFLISLGAAICTGGSGLIYILFGIRQLSANPASLPVNEPESKK